MSQQASASVATPTRDLEALAALSEVAVLESWLDHELQCESSLHSISEVACSVEVTHRVHHSCSEPTKLVCHNVANLLLNWMEGRLRCCAYCDKPCDECWQIVAV